MPDMANVHVDTFLTDLSLAYTNENYIADMVFPIVPADKRSDKYAIYNKDTFLRGSGKDSQGKPGSIRRPGSRSTKVVWDVSNQNFYCEQLAKSFDLYDALVNYADAPLQPSIDATMVVTESVTIDNELAVAGKVMKRANYASSNKAQLVTTTTSWATNAAPYSTSQTSFPISVDIPAGQKAVMTSLLRAPTHFLVNYNAAVTLKANWEYNEKIKYTSREGLTAGGLAPIIMGMQTVEARCQYVTSAEGVTITTGYSWVDDQGQDAALIYYKAPSATGLRTISFGLTFEAPDDSLNTRGFCIKRWREEWIDAEIIECRTTRDWRFTSTDGSTNGDNSSGYASGGYLISGVTI